MRQYISGLMRDERSSVIDAMVKFVLWLLSLLYSQLMRLRNVCYDREIIRVHDVGVPVISVGNITMGGAGKTPLVIYIARQLLDRGLKPAILLRGYMQEDSPEMFSDEAELIRDQLPGVDVILGADRVRRAREFLRDQQCDVFLLDDAFQHRRIKRQLDIAVIDACNPFGNGQVIPRGILREPLRGLSRADICVFTRTDLPGEKTADAHDVLQRWCPSAEEIKTVHRARALVNIVTGERLPVDVLAQQSVLAFCGLGNPQGFQGTLQHSGVTVAEFRSFPDHYFYRKEDISELAALAGQRGIGTLVTTHKDAVKLEQYTGTLKDVTIYYLDIEIEVTYGKEQFISRIVSLLRR